MLANQWINFIRLHVISFRGMELKFQLCCNSLKKFNDTCHMGISGMPSNCNNNGCHVYNLKN